MPMVRADELNGLLDDIINLRGAAGAAGALGTSPAGWSGILNGGAIGRPTGIWSSIAEGLNQGSGILTTYWTNQEAINRARYNAEQARYGTVDQQLTTTATQGASNLVNAMPYVIGAAALGGLMLVMSQRGGRRR